MRSLVAALDAGLRRGLTAAVKAVNTAVRANLNGSRSAPPWSYPVPRRTGNLLRSQQQQVAYPTGYVFNTATYAAAIHNGYVSEWAGQGKHRMRMKGDPRPFMDDGVETAQPLMVIQREVEGALQAWA
jgi:hypothetical protein